MKTILQMPKLGANDDTVQIDQWLVNDTDYVAKGQTIVVVETSKTHIEVQAEQSGHIKIVAKQGSEVAAGEVFAHVYTELIGIEKSNPQEESQDSSSTPQLPLMLSDKAKRQVEQSGVDIQTMKGLVSSRVLERCHLVSAQGTGKNDLEIDKSIFPDAYTKAVESAKRTEIKQLSHGTANQFSSSLTVQVESEPIREKGKYILGTNQNIFSVIMSSYVKLLKSYPKFLAYYHEGKIHYYNRVNLGVLVDFGKGLNVVVIKDADTLSAKQLHEHIVMLMCKSKEGRLSVEDVSHSTTTVSDLSSDNIYSFQPLINSRQSTILGIGADNDAEKKRLTFTLVFDHRVLTGRDVSIFLHSFKSHLLQGNQESTLTAARRRKI